MNRDIGNKYLIAITQPIKNGRYDNFSVQVYERLDSTGEQFLDPRGVQHMKFVGSFSYNDPETGKSLTLEQIMERVEKIVKKEG